MSIKVEHYFSLPELSNMITNQLTQEELRVFIKCLCVSMEYRDNGSSNAIKEVRDVLTDFLDNESYEGTK